MPVLVIAHINFRGRIYNFKVVVADGGSNLLSRGVAMKMGLVVRLDEAQKQQLKYDVFGTGGLMKTPPVHIHMKPDAKPYCVSTFRRVPFPLMDKVKEELERLQEHKSH